MLKTVILAGGFGTRLSEETELKPKPMVEIGSQPILWHIMKHYAHFGFNEFVVALGYKGEAIKRYFHDYSVLRGNISVQLGSGKIKNHGSAAEDWNLHLIDTGHSTLTGGRLKRLQSWIGKDTFLLTYGDGVSNVPLDKLLAFHKKHGKIATITAVRPPARFGGLDIEPNGNLVKSFLEKPQIGEGWINGGFMVFEASVFDLIKNGDDCVLESDVLEALALDGQLMAFRHEDYWQCMDTLREKKMLESLWASGKAPWKLWT